MKSTYKKTSGAEQEEEGKSPYSNDSRAVSRIKMERYEKKR